MWTISSWESTTPCLVGRRRRRWGSDTTRSLIPAGYVNILDVGQGSVDGNPGNLPEWSRGSE
ncbi:hypothetical protein GCM10009639_12860 [Kitasatospora putterlickiae]|uniref:Uncharacterized protein n=1 Tax=Kitasatospora putterlickiae TaxID=221725 RepID=A0ABN1XQF8_9ACTN